MGLFCWKACQERRMKKLQMRLDARTDRIETRQGGATDRTELRTNARIQAYANGINPSAPWASALGSVGNSVASIFGGGDNSGVVQTGIPKEYLLIGAGVLVLILIMSMSNKK